MLTDAGLDKARKRGRRGGGLVFVSNKTRGTARCADNTETDGHCCLAAGTQQDSTSAITGDTAASILMWLSGSLLSAQTQDLA